MAHAELASHRVRHVSMRLDCHHRIQGVRRYTVIRRSLVEVHQQLVERLGARPAGMAMLEEQEWATFRGGEKPVELVEPVEGRQLGMHSHHCTRRSRAPGDPAESKPRSILK